MRAAECVHRPCLQQMLHLHEPLGAPVLDVAIEAFAPRYRKSLHPLGMDSMWYRAGAPSLQVRDSGERHHCFLRHLVSVMVTVYDHAHHEGWLHVDRHHVQPLLAPPRSGLVERLVLEGAVAVLVAALEAGELACHDLRHDQPGHCLQADGLLQMLAPWP